MHLRGRRECGRWRKGRRERRLCSGWRKSWRGLRGELDSHRRRWEISNRLDLRLTEVEEHAEVASFGVEGRRELGIRLGDSHVRLLVFHVDCKRLKELRRSIRTFVSKIIDEEIISSFVRCFCLRFFSFDSFALLALFVLFSFLLLFQEALVALFAF